MQLLLEHSQEKNVFRLWAKYEIFGEDLALVEKYNIRSYVLVEGNPSQEKERALKLAGAAAVVIFLIPLFIFGFPGLRMAIVFSLIVFLGGSYVIYKNIRETVTVEEILNGRHFACRSIATLLQKKDQITEMAQKFTEFLEALKNWGGREVIDIAPDRGPVARFIERSHATSAVE